MARATCEAREPFGTSKSSHIAYCAVDDEPQQTPLNCVGSRQIANQRALNASGAIDYQHLTGFGPTERHEHGEIVARTGLDRQRRTYETTLSGVISLQSGHSTESS